MIQDHYVRETLANSKATIPTGRDWIDKMLGGGFPYNSMSLVYGEASTGKTTLAMHCAVEVARDDEKTLFIDSDHSFSLERLFQMVGSQADELADNIVLFSPISFGEQAELIENLENYVTHRLRLIVIDSITSLYSASLGSSERVFAQNRQLNRQLAYLAELAPKRELAILVTGRVHVKPVPGSRIELISKRLLTHWASVIIRLSKTGENGLNLATLEKYSKSGAVSRTCVYRITSEGLTGIGEETRKDGETGN
jgi:DNA repair protein RadB